MKRKDERASKLQEANVDVLGAGSGDEQVTLLGWNRFNGRLIIQELGGGVQLSHT